MNTWFSADFHLGHKNIIKYCNRPFKSLKEMDETIIRNHNTRVKDSDTLIHVGDFCFRNGKGGKEGEGGQNKAIDYLKRLNGNIVFVKGNHDCFSKKTRLLTKSGYKHCKEVKIGDFIPTINLNENKVEFKPIKDIIFNSVSKSYNFKTRTASGSFSSNHRHLYSFGVDGNLPIKIGTSEKLWDYKSPVKFLSSYKSGNVEYDVSDDWLKLLGWIYTDGSVIGKYKYIVLYQSKKVFVDEIESLLNKLKLKFSVSCRKRNINEICGKKLKKKVLPSYTFRVCAEDSRKIVKKLEIENRSELPHFLWRLSDRQCKIFVQELVKGNGSVASSGTLVLWGKKFMLEQVMGLCVTHNLHSNLIEDERKEYYLTIGARKHNREKNFKYKHVSFRQKNIKRIEEEMWCVNVKNGVIFIEHEGQTLITGNSNNSLRTFIESVILRTGKKKQCTVKLVHNPVYANECFDFNFCGHVHQNWKYKQDPNIINVGVDVNKFMPISFDEAINGFEKWEKVNV